MFQKYLVLYFPKDNKYLTNFSSASILRQKKRISMRILFLFQFLLKKWFYKLKTKKYVIQQINQNRKFQKSFFYKIKIHFRQIDFRLQQTNQSNKVRTINKIQQNLLLISFKQQPVTNKSSSQQQFFLLFVTSVPPKFLNHPSTNFIYKKKVEKTLSKTLSYRRVHSLTFSAQLSNLCFIQNRKKTYKKINLTLAQTSVKQSAHKRIISNINLNLHLIKKQDQRTYDTKIGKSRI
eukprot:TRINITY_DN25205_c0_g1_i4.p1 TRINITY_DN25205_c0_g1~~TRINITY_DN25205_c0_g1_i4.p1  ORF type:complete len:235 (-),score=-12.74 TRINITY_DN25205_c0_g1_i4:665-1369(-)